MSNKYNNLSPGERQHGKPAGMNHKGDGTSPGIFPVGKIGHHWVGVSKELKLVIEKINEYFNLLVK